MTQSITLQGLDETTRLRVPLPERGVDGGERRQQTLPPSSAAVRRCGLLPRQRAGNRRNGRGDRGGREREPPSVLRVRAAPRDLGGGHQQARADRRGWPEAPARSRAPARGPTDEAPRREGEPYRQARGLRTRTAGPDHARPRRGAARLLTRRIIREGHPEASRPDR